jgi:cytochrome b
VDDDPGSITVGGLMAARAEVTIWDPLVRIGHWLIVAGFAIDYVTDEPRVLHVWVGYIVAAIVVLRILWGFVGSRPARFREFVYRPAMVLAYLRDLLLLRSRRYLGHSPAGGAMVVALLVMLCATGVTGLLTDGARNHAGPLAFWFVTPQSAGAPMTAPANVAAPVAPPQEWRPYKQVHSLLANLTLVLIGFHVAGVLFASYAHRENLVRAMLTGRKRQEEPQPGD